ncbi:hypothetical protein L1049_026603 [Liquidambar formosana]|uniref:TF-B3 domain-containing protein n=1 Tax=Liquidambar formosana TaxID=63359 RepID=A0AAP0NDM1_LIQFO
MGESCKGCRKWEEEMYWTHFQSIHFFQFLSGDFLEELTIPKKFADNLRGKLPESVTLKGPSGATWNVGLTTTGDALLFKHGWKEFVEDHSLQQNDVLVFTYDGNSRFDVLVFDRGSLCEKEFSYFVRKCGHIRLEDEYPTMRKTGESSVEVIPVLPNDDVRCTSSKEPMMDEPLTPVPSGKRNIGRANGKVRKAAHCSKPVNAKLKLRSREPSTCTEGATVNFDRVGAHQLQYISNRRPVTEEEKEIALQMAQAASTSESFIVVMRPTHVYKRYYMTIPSKWVASHLSEGSQDVILRVKENTWHAKYYYWKGRNVGGLTCGWKNFAVENNLEEFDVCMFELASQEDNIILDVNIFRVVKEVTPPTPVNSAPLQVVLDCILDGNIAAVWAFWTCFTARQLVHVMMSWKFSKMEESCKDCRKWEEEMYWTHFRSINFCQFLSGNFLEELTIPKKFANNLKGKLPESVTLKGPSGATWNVGLTTSGDACCLNMVGKNFQKIILFKRMMS